MKVNISTVHLDTLGIIHDFQLIAAIESQLMPCMLNENPYNAGAME
jgi:hypothetical protein